MEDKLREISKALRKNHRVNYDLEKFKPPRRKTNSAIRAAVTAKIQELRDAQGYIHMKGKWCISQLKRMVELSYDHPVNEVPDINCRILFRVKLEPKWIEEAGRGILINGECQELVVFGRILKFEEPSDGPFSLDILPFEVYGI